MSRKFDRKQRIEQRARELLVNPYVAAQILSHLLRPKPRWVPNLIWRGLQNIVLR